MRPRGNLARADLLWVADPAQDQLDADTVRSSGPRVLGFEIRLVRPVRDPGHQRDADLAGAATPRTAGPRSSNRNNGIGAAPTCADPTSMPSNEARVGWWSAKILARCSRVSAMRLPQPGTRPETLAARRPNTVQGVYRNGMQWHAYGRQDPGQALPAGRRLHAYVLFLFLTAKT
jgi:hypothetical protein